MGPAATAATAGRRLANLGGTLTVTGTTVDHNKAGGDGGDGGNGGNGLGGGLYNGAASTLTLTGATVQFNFAVGGAAGSGGSDGQGVGGGVYRHRSAFDPTTRHQEEPRLHQQRRYLPLSGPWSLILSPWCSASRPGWWPAEPPRTRHTG